MVLQTSITEKYIYVKHIENNDCVDRTTLSIILLSQLFHRLKGNLLPRKVQVI